LRPELGVGRDAFAPLAIDVKRAKQKAAPKPRNPVARSPLMRKGGAHAKSTAAQRRRARMDLQRQLRTADGDS